MARNKDYDWIEDPFREDPQLQENKGMKTSSKVCIGCGCLIVLLGVLVLFVLFFFSLTDLLAS